MLKNATLGTGFQSTWCKGDDDYRGLMWVQAHGGDSAVRKKMAGPIKKFSSDVFDSISGSMSKEQAFHVAQLNHPLRMDPSDWSPMRNEVAAVSLKPEWLTDEHYRCAQDAFYSRLNGYCVVDPDTSFLKCIGAKDYGNKCSTKADGTYDSKCVNHDTWRTAFEWMAAMLSASLHDKLLRNVLLTMFGRGSTLDYGIEFDHGTDGEVDGQARTMYKGTVVAAAEEYLAVSHIEDELADYYKKYRVNERFGHLGQKWFNTVENQEARMKADPMYAAQISAAPKQYKAADRKELFVDQLRVCALLDPKYLEAMRAL